VSSGSDVPVSKRPLRRDWVIASAVGLFLVSVAFLGADKPPPPGFLYVIAMAGVVTLLVAFAMPRWRATKALPECRSPRGPTAQGAVVGVGLWLVALAVPGMGEPSIQLTLIDYLVGGALAASLGALGAALLARLA